MVATAVWSYVLLGRAPDWQPWLRYTVLVVGLAVAVALVGAPYLKLPAARWIAVGLATVGIVTALAAPAAFTMNSILNNPTSWYWNIRVGDKLQIDGSGLWYTVVGPMVLTPQDGNSELFVNVGVAGKKSPFSDTQGNPGVAVNPEFLFLVNGTRRQQERLDRRGLRRGRQQSEC